VTFSNLSLSWERQKRTTVRRRKPLNVMPGLVPGIHVFQTLNE